MFQDLDIGGTIAALELLTANLTKLSEERKQLETENQQLKDQREANMLKISQLARLDSNHSGLTNRLAKLAAEQHEDGTLGPSFGNVGIDRPSSRVVVTPLETQWIDWVEKELQFAKEMRQAFERVDRKRGHDDTTTSPEDQANKRARVEENQVADIGPSRALARSSGLMRSRGRGRGRGFSKM